MKRVSSPESVPIHLKETQVKPVLRFSEARHIQSQQTGTVISILEWMACDLSSFSKVFQSYKEDGRLIMKGCLQRNLF